MNNQWRRGNVYFVLGGGRDGGGWAVVDFDFVFQ